MSSCWVMVDVSGVELVYDSTKRSDSMINGGILGGTNSIYFTSSIVERARGSRNWSRRVQRWQTVSVH